MSATRVGHWKRERCDVYFGRGKSGSVPNYPAFGSFGNPFTIQAAGERALECFKTYFLARVERDPVYRAAVLAQRGKLLGCWCSLSTESKPCHARIVAAWIDAQPAGRSA